MENQIRVKKKIAVGHIPDDLVPEILQELPAKTLVRFLCVSKQYSSMIRNRDFIKSYLFKSTQSLMFTFESEEHETLFFFSSILPPNPGESVSSSSSSVATFHMQCYSHTTVAPSVHGLICYLTPYKFKLYNPSTRTRSPRSLNSRGCPKIKSWRNDSYHYLGYDPIDADYKLLLLRPDPSRALYYMDPNTLGQELWVLTVGNGNEWRMIKNFPPHSPSSLEICINGVLYYEAFVDTDPRSIKKQAVMSFDVRSEKIDLIKIPSSSYSKLTSYEGKLAIMYSCSWCCFQIKISLWVLVDATKHEWSEKVFVLPCWESELSFQVFCLTDAGEFVLAAEEGNLNESSPFYVLCYDWKKNVVRRVFIEGITKQSIPNWNQDLDFRTLSIFPGQVENLMFL